MNKALIIFIVYTTICFGIISWIMNGGWLRIIYLPVFLIHLLLFITINALSIHFLDSENNKLKILIIISCFSMLITNVVIPDFGDYGGYRVFFGLIKNEDFINICFKLFPIFIVLHSIICIIQLIVTLKCMKKKKG